MRNSYQLIEVNSKQTRKAFLELPVKINAGDRNWIRPLDQDIEQIFNPDINKRFKKGDAIRWILKDGQNHVVGRIAVFYDLAVATKQSPLAGGCGFFECIHDQEAANLLFEAAKAWLEDKGMEAMDGPINFGDRDHFWGCLADGFFPPLYNMPYNPAYYNQLFENYGFKNYFNQYTYHVPLNPDLLDPVIIETGTRLLKNPKYDFHSIDVKRLEKYADDLVTIFNEAWAKFPGVKPMRKQQAMILFRKMKPVIDPRVIFFAYHEERPIGFFIMIPDLFQSYRKFNGQLHLLNKLRLMFDLKVARNYTRLVGLIFGIVPDFQKKGIANGIIMRFADLVRKPGFDYADLEMNWVADFNPSMMKLAEQIGAKILKTHITYRYLFDRNKPFERAKKVS
jgi:hypothetical protein